MKYIHIFALLFGFRSCCNGQVNTNASKPIPNVIRNFKPASLAPDFDTTLVSQYIRSIFQDSKGNIWFGTIGDGVVRYDVKTLTYFSTPDGFINQTVYAINEDKDGNMWFGTDQGVYKYDGKTFKNYSQKDGLTHVDITRKGILFDKSGNSWVGTHGGVYRYDHVADRKGQKSFSLFKKLGAVNIAGIMEDKEGTIWFASSNTGVFRYKPSEGEKSLVHLKEIENLGENYAGGIAQDKAGNMWFTMKNGICKYDGKTFTSYTSKDGLGGTEFWGILIEESGIIWVTARGSTTRFDPTIPLPNPNAFKVFTPADGLNCCV
ncbi:ligand-binding sensor domain-containing protein [Xanthocytophaga flava]|uniref:ligand-binding sensor domain-containing protein n=1 Tax=Xanthocytophaga flava TaxID=3048013 RepID=UPI0028D66E6B|nr:two-component regulator propeller domain-containing protein [Xanthocytophaga flavus]MDJ1467605.1 two-component regulator propeller domain-containing protein [Xanthocytophaga flavus]